MRVAMLAPIAWPTPPRGYGPWERVAATLTDALVDLGVHVTLYATGDSHTRGQLRSVVAHGYEEDPGYDVKVFEALHIAKVFEEAAEHDLVHNHFDFLPLTWSRLVDTPVVTTIHGFSSPSILPAYRVYDDRVRYVAISDADRDPNLSYIATIYNGVDLDDFPYCPEPENDGHVVSFGRIHPDKGTAEAIDIARAAGRRILLAGIVHDLHYFDTEVCPRLDRDVVYLGPVEGAERARVLGAAGALLHPISFAEPFGLSVVEALACGTPVVTYPKGAMPEVVRDGETGFLVPDADEAVAALGKLDSIDRADCRADAELRFSAQRMAADYLAVYRRILEGGR